MKSDIKELQKIVDSKDKKGATEQLVKVYKSIDKAAKRGIIKKNNAARKKSNAAAKVKTIA